MVSVFGFRSTMACLRKVRVTIPRLSPTHTKASIVRFCPPSFGNEPPTSQANVYVECTDALFILKCSPDVLEEGYREQTSDGSDVFPMMIVESHDEGDFSFDPSIRLGEWYNVGEIIGTIDDGDDGDADDEFDDANDWLWQAYSYKEDCEDRELNLPPHIATGKITSA